MFDSGFLSHLDSRSSKDATIRVWDRETLKPHRVFRGHEGPVNAVGLEGSRVVSRSFTTSYKRVFISF
jgi:WD40 repeat protein